MNYIPGFSNYLETTVPEYGPAPIMDAEPAAPQRAAVAPMTQEAVAPYDLSGLGLSEADLARLYALSANNAGGSSGGMAGLPSLGAGYVPQFEEELITAPISNKGNPTAYGANNQFYMSPNDFVRLVDRSTNSVVFEGTGYEAAQKAVEMGQNMTDTMGRKADYQIQTGKTQDSYVPVANEKFNKSTAGKIANAVGTVAPLAMALIPGANLTLLGSKLAGGVAAGALLGGASAGLKGDNILKGAALGGLTAYGGQALGPLVGSATGASSGLARAIGTGIGATAGGLATGQNLKNSLLGGVVSGGLSYVAPSIQRELGIGQGPNVSSGSTGANVASGPAPIATVIGNTGVSAPVSFGGGSSPQTKVAELEPPATIVSGSGSPFAAAFPIPSNVLSMAQPTPAADQMSEEDIIKVTGERLGAVTPNVSIPTSDARGPLSSVVDGMDTGTGEIVAEGNRFRNLLSPNVVIPDSALSPEVLRAIEGPPEDDIIKVTGQRSDAVTPYGPIFGLDTPLPDMSGADADAEAKKKLGLEEYLRLAGLAAGLIGGAAGGGSGQTGTYGGTGNGRLNPIFSAKLPAAGGLGNVGLNRTQRPMGDVDWLTYGTRPELNFFDYAAQNNPTPVTTPVPGNPAGPIMQQRDPMAMFEGGTPSAKHGDQSRRSEFAVNGPGTGRSDDIPAVLSDGEYVIDAETVALLGDGSSKAGAKKLDDLRVKVRKHKGKKLAKGRFSANAKKPEAYLSGGRI